MIAYKAFVTYAPGLVFSGLSQAMLHVGSTSEVLTTKVPRSLKSVFLKAA